MPLLILGLEPRTKKRKREAQQTSGKTWRYFWLSESEKGSRQTEIITRQNQTALQTLNLLFFSALIWEPTQ